MRNTFIIIFLLLQYALVHSQVPKGDRLLSYQVSSSESQTYDEAFQFAIAHCMDMNHLQYLWGNYETSAGVFDPENMQFLDITNIYYPAYNMPLELNIGTMNTTVNAIPSDLLNMAYDDPMMIERFKAFLDTVFDHIPDVEIKLLNIGNESAIFMGTDAEQYTRYKTFLNAVVPYAKEKYMALHGIELPVGTTLSYERLTDFSTSSLCHQLNDGLDIVSATYYPLLPGFQMNIPIAVHDDFDNLVNEYPDIEQAIYMVECGYASSPICGANESMQAQFFEEVFLAWDTHYDNIKSLSIFKVADWSQADVDELGEYYGIDDEAFLEYLRSLGLRTFSGVGEDKEAMNSIRCALSERNWCPIDCAVGLPEVQRSNFSVYPNPASTHVTIELPMKSDFHAIQLVDLTGRVIMETSLSNQLHITLTLPEVSSGIYSLRLLRSNGDTLNRQLVIE
ncbi:MAG: hypothetical protein ACI81Y_001832 [Glaciecola sp.]|jgi:hypothetical protein